MATTSPGHSRFGSAGFGSSARFVCTTFHQYRARSGTGGTWPHARERVASAIDHRSSPGRTVHVAAGRVEGRTEGAERVVAGGGEVGATRGVPSVGEIGAAAQIPAEGGEVGATRAVPGVGEIGAAARVPAGGGEVGATPGAPGAGGTGARAAAGVPDSAAARGLTDPAAPRMGVSAGPSYRRTGAAVSPAAVVELVPAAHVGVAPATDAAPNADTPAIVRTAALTPGGDTTTRCEAAGGRTPSSPARPLSKRSRGRPRCHRALLGRWRTLPATRLAPATR